MEVHDVTKEYLTWSSWRPQPVKVIKNLSVKLTAGKCLGLLGVNGAGKSTSFRILTKETPPTTGTLLPDNVSILFLINNNKKKNNFYSFGFIWTRMKLPKVIALKKTHYWMILLEKSC